MTALANYEPAPSLIWLPKGDEPLPCDWRISGDGSCVSDHAFGVTFAHPAVTAAGVTMWLYAAANDGEYYVVAWRWHQRHGALQRWGNEHRPRVFRHPQDATDAALDAAAGLACGIWDGWLGGIPDCLQWDGMPEHMGEKMPLPWIGGMP